MIRNTTASDNNAHAIALLAIGPDNIPAVKRQPTHAALALELQKVAALLMAPDVRIDETEIFHGSMTLVSNELKLIGASRTLLNAKQAHFSIEDKCNAIALIARGKSGGEYVKTIAQWQPWQKQMFRLRQSEFADLDQHVTDERTPLTEQPFYTSENDYVESCKRKESMKRERLTFNLENWTRELMVQNKQSALNTG